MFSLSKRWEILLYLFSGVLINYCLRVNMSIAASEISNNLSYSNVEKGYLLSSFFWGYSIGQIPSTLIAQKYGHKYIYGLAILLSSFITLLLPSACKYSLNIALFIRSLTGLTSSALFPSSYHFFPRWIPLAEKTLMISVFGSGMYVGEIIGFSVSGYLVGTDENIKLGDLQIGGWPSSFYFFGLVGLLWTPFYFFNVYGSPDEHPTISPEEKLLISKGLIDHDVKYDVEYSPSNEADSLLSHQHDDVSISSHRIHSSSTQPELRKRISSVGGAIASESLYASPNIENNSSNPNLTSLIPSYHNQQQQQQQQNSSLLYNDSNISPKHSSTVVSSKARSDFTFSDIPWVAFFTTPQSLVLFLCHWCYAFVGFILLTEIPAFLTEELDYDIESAGLLSIAPYAANFISTIIFAFYFDHVEEVGGWSTRKVRQRSMQVTFLGSGGCLVICVFMKQRELAYFFLILSLFFFGANHSGIHCAYLDVSPNFSSIMNTIGNTCGAVAGLTGPLMVSLLTTSFDSSFGWKLSFLIVFGQCIVTLIFWSIYQTSEIVPSLNTPYKKI